MKESTPSSEQVRDLLDRFLAAAPGTARSLVADTARAVVEGLGRPTISKDWVVSPAGIAVLGGGAALFGAGWLLGRQTRRSRQTGLCLAAAASAGVAAALVLRARRSEASLAPLGEAAMADEDVAGE